MLLLVLAGASGEGRQLCLSNTRCVAPHSAVTAYRVYKAAGGEVEEGGTCTTLGGVRSRERSNAELEVMCQMSSRVGNSRIWDGGEIRSAGTTGGSREMKEGEKER